MKSASAGLIALLNSAQQFVFADLYTWTLRDGTIARYTSADINLTIGGVTWNCAGSGAPLHERDQISTIMGAQADDLTVTVHAGPNDLIGGTPWLQAVQQGKLDGATLLLEHFIADNWAATGLGKMYGFKGRVSASEVNRTSAKITIKSPLELLDLQMPRNIYMPGCWHTLYDAGCTLSKAAFTVASAVNDAGPTATTFKTNLTQADHYFELGSITFTSGALDGLIRRVQSYANANGLVTVVPPLPSAPANGDTFSIYPGCDKQQATCSGKFTNLPNFGGHPYIPIPETAY